MCEQPGKGNWISATLRNGSMPCAPSENHLPLWGHHDTSLITWGCLFIPLPHKRCLYSAWPSHFSKYTVLFSFVCASEAGREGLCYSSTSGFRTKLPITLNISPLIYDSHLCLVMFCEHYYLSFSYSPHQVIVAMCVTLSLGVCMFFLILST